ncbi:MAG: ankyrin repeat domain-containing protein [Legionella sp.]|nr:ankyrin repeat domain-containing protein [Legionella sp.]
MTHEAQWQWKFNKLKILIEKRQEFEAKNHFPPYSTHPTDINFPDENGVSLIHYAIWLGQLDTVKDLVQNGAILENAINYALANGELAIAKYFLHINNNCAGVDLNLIANEECRKWFKNIIKESLENRSHNSFFSSPIAYSEYYQSKSVNKTRLERAAEIGELDLIQDYQNTIKKGPNESIIMKASVSNNEMEVFNYLVANGLKINPVIPYIESCLEVAINFQKNKAVDYLLANGANINYPGKLKKTALITAAEIGNVAIFEKILKNKPDITARDVLGQTALHYAVINNHIEIVSLLLAEPGIADIVNYVDIYGMTALDYAKENSRQDIATLLGHPVDSDDKLKPLVDISQFFVMQKMKYYLLTQYRDLEFFNEKGHCNGLAFLRDLYSYKGREDYFFETLELMASWDGEQESLNEAFEEGLPQKQYYKNLSELFEQWINDIIWFQHSTLESIFEYKPGENFQENRQFQWDVLGEESLPKPILISSFRDVTTMDCLLENMEIYSQRMPPGTRLELSGSGHGTSAFKKNDNTLSYYDPNLSRKTRPFVSSRDFTDVVVDTKLIMLDKYRENNVDVAMRFFYYDTPDMAENITNHNPFAAHEWPQNEEDVVNFQKKSPNAYTPLHIAVITGSISAVNKLLEDGYCKLTTPNTHQKTALILAVESKNIEIIKALLEVYPADKITAEEVLTVHNLNNQELMEVLLKKQGVDFSLVFFSAMNKKDFSLLRRLLAERKVNTDITDGENTALSKAFDLGDGQLLRFLLEHDFHLNASSTYFKKISHSNLELYSIALPYLQNINEVDEKDNALVHHVIDSSTSLDNKKTMIEQLKNLKVDLNKTNAKGKTPFQLLMSNWFFDASYKIEIMKLLLPYVTIEPRMQVQSLLMASIQMADHVAFNFLLSHCSPETLNNYNTDGFCPLHLAFLMRDKEMIDKLLLKGADINKPVQRGGNTCLHRIVLTEDTAFLDKFLENGASIDIENAEGQTVSDLLDSSSNQEFKEKFLRGLNYRNGANAN